MSDDKGFAELFAEQGSPERGKRLQMGDEVTGRVVAIGSTSVFLDVGDKSEAMIDRAELCDADGNLDLAVGDKVTARVASRRDGQIVLRTKIGRGANATEQLQQAQQSGIPVEGTVAAVNKGGVEVDVAGTPAFCPVSQLDVQFVEDLGSFVGQKLTFRITRVEEGRGGKPNIVLSRRALLEEERAKIATETRARLEVGGVVHGKVSALKDYGAFVDLGGIEGMLHISELGFGRIKHPSEVLTVGAAVEVQIIKIEQTDNPKRPERIGLSLKALKEDPFDAAADQLVEGQRLAGTVTRLEPFGAFVALPSGVEGLVHVSQLGANRHVNHARDVVAVDQEVDVVVLGIDREKRRVSLSMKAVSASIEADHAASYNRASGQQASSSLGTFADLLKNKK